MDYSTITVIYWALAVTSPSPGSIPILICQITVINKMCIIGIKLGASPPGLPGPGRWAHDHDEVSPSPKLTVTVGDGRRRGGDGGTDGPREAGRGCREAGRQGGREGGE
eukprot:765031-Hanusia_phi.AAC.1